MVGVEGVSFYGSPILSIPWAPLLSTVIVICPRSFMRLEAALCVSKFFVHRGSSLFMGVHVESPAGALRRRSADAIEDTFVAVLFLKSREIRCASYYSTFGMLAIWIGGARYLPRLDAFHFQRFLP